MVEKILKDFFLSNREKSTPVLFIDGFHVYEIRKENGGSFGIGIREERHNIVRFYEIREEYSKVDHKRFVLTHEILMCAGPSFMFGGILCYPN